MTGQETGSLGRILAIDEAPEVLFALVAQLHRYAVVGVRNLEAALALSPQHFDVILADVRPGRDDALTLRRALGDRRVTTPVIFMSEDAEQARAAREAQAFGFVRKPLDGQELEWVLRSAVSPLSGRPRTTRSTSKQITRRYDLEGLSGRKAS
jgi:DNA-binding NtrC family response regulator